MTRELRIQNAKNFVRSIASATSNRDYLYMFIGRNNPWNDSNGLGVDSNGVEIPTTPTDKLFGQELVTRDKIIGLKRVQETNVYPVVPRINWTTGVTYAAYSNNNVNLYTTNFYVMNSTYDVYKCITAGGGVSTVEPTGTSTSNLGPLSDGYIWKYLYTVPTGAALDFLTTDWLPVPYPAVGTLGGAVEQIDVEAAASYASGQPILGHGSSALHELGAYYLMISLSFAGNEGIGLPTSDDFRQVGLIANPILSGGSAATGTVYLASSINTLKGRVLYVENRAPIVRSTTQTENIKIVLEF